MYCRAGWSEETPSRGAIEVAEEEEEEEEGGEGGEEGVPPIASSAPPTHPVLNPTSPCPSPSLLKSVTRPQ
jgi:hypothetical protein